MRVDPESVYLEPTQTFLLNRASGDVTTGRGVSVHFKEGARWRCVLLVPDDGETFATLLGRIGSWIEDEQHWTSQLLHGLGNVASGDSR